MRHLLVLLFIAIMSILFVLSMPEDASGTSKKAPRLVERWSVGISYPKSNLKPPEAIIDPRTQPTNENQATVKDNPRKISTFKATVTAYNSVPEQTDGEPCIAADGTDICLALEHGERACAANSLRFGTRLVIPGIGECVVRDRTASRFGSRIDVYFGGRDQIKAARDWGKKQNLVITLIK